MKATKTARRLGVIAILSLATIGCGGSSPRIDATTVDSFNASLETMKAGVTKAEAAKLDAAIQFYIFNATPALTGKHVTKAKDKKAFDATTKDDQVRGLMAEIYAPLHGLTAPEVVEKCMIAGKEFQKNSEEMIAKARGDQAKRPPKDAPRDEGVEVAWSLKDAYDGVAVDQVGQNVYAVHEKGRCDIVDLEGKVRRTVNLEGFTPLTSRAGTHEVRTARIAKGEEALIVFDRSPVDQSVLACRTDGTKLWSGLGAPRKTLGSLMDVAVADLDGDGVDELVVGYGGSPGLQVFSTQGKPLWERPELGNGWNVAAGDLDGDGKVEVLSTSAQGKVYFFSPKDGSPVRTLDPGLYARILRSVPGKSLGVSGSDFVLVAGRSNSLVALEGDGRTRWSLNLSESFASCRSLSVSHDGLWTAALLSDGRIRIVDLGHSQVVGQGAGQGVGPSQKAAIAWAHRSEGKSPLLVIATGNALNAFRLKPDLPSPGA